jgi:hypothetical protein
VFHSNIRKIWGPTWLCWFSTHCKRVMEVCLCAHFGKAYLQLFEGYLSQHSCSANSQVISAFFRLSDTFVEVYKAGQFTSESFDEMEVQSENILEEVCILRYSFAGSGWTHRFKYFWHAFSFCQMFYQDLYGQSFFTLFHHFVPGFRFLFIFTTRISLVLS